MCNSRACLERDTSHPAVDGSRASRGVTNEKSSSSKLCTRFPPAISLRFCVSGLQGETCMISAANPGYTLDGKIHSKGLHFFASGLDFHHTRQGRGDTPGMYTRPVKNAEAGEVGIGVTDNWYRSWILRRTRLGSKNLAEDTPTRSSLSDLCMAVLLCGPTFLVFLYSLLRVAGQGGG